MPPLPSIPPRSIALLAVALAGLTLAPPVTAADARLVRRADGSLAIVEAEATPAGAAAGGRVPGAAGTFNRLEHARPPWRPSAFDRQLREERQAVRERRQRAIEAHRKAREARARAEADERERRRRERARWRTGARRRAVPR